MAAAAGKAPQSTGTDHPLVLALAAVSVGIVVERSIAIPLGRLLIVAATALLAWWAVRRWFGPRLLTALLLLAMAATSGAFHHLRWRLFPLDELALVEVDGESHPVCVEVVAWTSPRRRSPPPPDPMHTLPLDVQTEFDVLVERVRDGQRWQAATGRARLVVGGELRGVAAGDRLHVIGRLSVPTAPLNPGEFDFSAHQRAQRELCRISCDAPQCVTVLERSSRRRLWQWLQVVRDAGDRQLTRHLRRAQAALASAVLLGIREQVDTHRIEQFMTTGTVHLLAISGLHVGILAAGFWLTSRLGWLSRRKTLWLAIALVVFYALLTDARPPVVRAAVLICVLCAARLAGRPAFEFNTLALAALIVLAMNPANLFQIGTQLSFLAVATLACWQDLSVVLTAPEDPLDRLIAQSRPWPHRWLRRGASACWRLTMASGVIWLVALPLVMYRFHLFSPIAVILNPIVSLPMAVALFAGFGVLVLGWVAPPLAAASGWVCDQSLWCIEACIAIAVQVPYGYAWVPAPPAWWVVVFYAVLLVWVVAPGWRPGGRSMGLAAAIWIALGLAWGPLQRQWQRGDEVVCTFVAVGHGTSVLVEFPAGETLLYDAGRLGLAPSGVRPISSVLWSRGITRLDAVVVSHADADHYNAIPGLLERYAVGAVYVSPLMFRHPSDALDALRQTIEAHDVPLRLLSSRHPFPAVPQADLEVLFPAPEGVPGSDNANSLVLQITHRGRSILLPGDLETPGLEYVLAQRRRDCAAVMAPHHGSTRSNPAGFAAWTTPEVVVISGGHGNSLATVCAAYQAQGAVVLHTQADGAVRITLGDELAAAHWAKHDWQPVPITGANAIGAARDRPAE